MIPEELRYTEDHEWIRADGATATIGITDHAQSALGDIVFVELPKVGASFERGEAFGVIESVKAASDCNLPVAGKIVEVNASLEDAPQNVNQDPYGAGWMVKVEMEDASQVDSLLDAAAYAEIVKKEE